jgi:type II restriction/modification system DNA methylase subunit YeeA
MANQMSLFKPRKALNKAFLKVKPNRTEIERFKTHLIQLIDRINDSESEEFHKNLVIDFLKKTYYDPNHFINTKGRNDLVIHNGDKAASTVGVIIEAKKPSNKGEMLTQEHINVKAFQELVLYYLRERITHKNIEIKYLIATNIYEWFIFDATLFDRLFAQNKNLVNQFNDFEGGRLADTKTDFFYKHIAEPFIAGLNHDVEFTYFNIREYEKPLRNNDRKDDNKLIALFKLLSPEHLLKLPFVNDSNSLDKRFYSELLHIIGLTETKDGGKKLIGRSKEGQRNKGSFLENAINQLDSLDKISRLDNPGQFGSNLQDRLFNVALELSITWINRILFLKLLEAQLISYHKKDQSFKFLNVKTIKDYDDLNSLFFQVLARKQSERNEELRQLYSRVPYLNSSLFEPTDMEHTTIFISNLRDDCALPISVSTVLKDSAGKKRTGNLHPLQYLFEFLDAYDFASEGSEEIQEENKTLINASVLGLIFEKINGYKDGSFFTPGFITMYMCRETIRRAVVQKFNEVKGWNCPDIHTIYNKIEDIKEANQIINHLKICDPAVGSGHFLVSALNEIIAIKSDLKILQDREGRRLKEYHFEVVNDELIITDEDGELFGYNPMNKESQRIQETLFHEKQTIIENCLFGVDINPNSVKICRLRLWIELLKNAYYKNESELETLPNIDINIKCGNSLISRFALDADLKQALKKSASKWTIDSYRVAVATYRNAGSKEEKRTMERLINEIKTNFRSEIAANDPKVKQLNGKKGELFTLTNQGQLFQLSAKEKADWNNKVAKLTTDITKIEAEIEEIKSNKIYENAFEWRFEFPEVLDDQGDFVGFDVVIGNPPYYQIQKLDTNLLPLKSNYETFEQTGDIYILFYERGFQILNPKGILNFITSNKWLRASYGTSFRKFLINNAKCQLLIDFNFYQVFGEASVDTNILCFTKGTSNSVRYAVLIQDGFKKNEISDYVFKNANEISNLTEQYWNIISKERQGLNENLQTLGVKLKNWNLDFNRGILTGLNEAFIIDEETKNLLISEDPKNQEIIVPYLKGRDIRRYGFSPEKLWLINAHNGVKDKEIKRINVEKDYPSIFKHLKIFEIKAIERADKGDHWTNLRNCAYLIDFSKEKLVYAETMRVHKSDLSNFPRFGFDDSGHYCDKTTFIATGKNIKFLLGILNSKVGAYLIKEYVTKLDSGGYMMQKVFLEEIPIIQSSPNDMITPIVKEIIALKKQNPNSDTTALESQIDQLVYQLYDLTPEEIAIVENAVNNPGGV